MKAATSRGMLATSAVSFVLVLAGAVWAYLRLRNLGTPIILHFSDFSGIDRIGAPADLLQYGGLGLVIVGVNSALALTLAPRDRLWAGIIMGTTLFMAVLIFILFTVIISVN